MALVAQKMETQVSRKELITEFFGTAWLVFIGTSAIVISQEYYSLGSFGIPFAFFIAVWTGILFTRKWSSSHLNPAVSLFFWLENKYSLKKLIFLIFVQSAGAILGSYLVSLFASDGSGLGATLPNSGIINTFFIETLLSFLLIILIAFADKIQPLAAFFIALLVGIEAFFGGPFTGASMNPARSLGPATIGNSWDYNWIYWLAPFFGAILVNFTLKGLKK